MEGFTRDRLLDSERDDLDWPRQFAPRVGYSTDALVYLLQVIYEAVDAGSCAARLFFADFSIGNPHKRRFCLYVRNIKKCMGINIDS